MNAAITTAIVDAVVSVLKSKFARVSDRAVVQANIDRHVLEALAWSNRIQFYGMAAAEETDANSISLSFSPEPRRFYSKSTSVVVDENVLLNTRSNYLLLGNVGAGKTTTLKRLTRKLIAGEPTGELDTYQCPVVVIGRELRGSTRLVVHLAKTLSIPFTMTQEIRDDEREVVEYWCRDELLQHVVVRVLNEAQVVLILDGLDEVSADAIDVVLAELEWLAKNLRAGKVVASTRAGEYTSLLDGFELLEVCALSRNEILGIARVWLPDTCETFISCLDALPYADLVDRPLLLAQLLFLFKRYGELPDQPADIYKGVVELLLREWDAERRINRRSRYAQFDTRRKMAFLAAIAYELTYRIKVKKFSEVELRRAYTAVCDRFALPHEEMDAVIAELETHTGLIERSGLHQYEFSHLSLQEYLCADYLVRDQFATNLVAYLYEYPSPVAVAVTLSSNPSDWFAAIVLRYSGVVPPASIHGLLTRLLLERPLFNVSASLGLALMKLYCDMISHVQIIDVVNQFVRRPTVLQSISSAIPYFRFPTKDERLANVIVFKRAASVGLAGPLPIPERGALPRQLFDVLRPPLSENLQL